MPSKPSGSRAFASRRPGLVLELEVVVILGPVVPDEQQHPQQLLQRSPDTRDTAPGDTCNLMIKCSRRSGHDIPSAVQSPANRRAHDLSIGLESRTRLRSADPPAAAGQSLPEKPRLISLEA